MDHFNVDNLPEHLLKIHLRLSDAQIGGRICPDDSQRLDSIDSANPLSLSPSQKTVGLQCRREELEFLERTHPDLKDDVGPQTTFENSPVSVGLCSLLSPPVHFSSTMLTEPPVDRLGINEEQFRPIEKNRRKQEAACIAAQDYIRGDVMEGYSDSLLLLSQKQPLDPEQPNMSGNHWPIHAEHHMPSDDNLQLRLLPQHDWRMLMRLPEEERGNMYNQVPEAKPSVRHTLQDHQRQQILLEVQNKKILMRVPEEERGNTNNQVPEANSSQRHALQDYQMQLMLLEAQNKKRLMKAPEAESGNLENGGAEVNSSQRIALEDYHVQLRLLEAQNKKRLWVCRQEIVTAGSSNEHFRKQQHEVNSGLALVPGFTPTPYAAATNDTEKRDGSQEVQGQKNTNFGLLHSLEETGKGFGLLADSSRSTDSKKSRERQSEETEDQSNIQAKRRCAIHSEYTFSPCPPIITPENIDLLKDFGSSQDASKLQTLAVRQRQPADPTQPPQRDVRNAEPLNVSAFDPSYLREMQRLTKKGSSDPNGLAQQAIERIAKERSVPPLSLQKEAERNLLERIKGEAKRLPGSWPSV